jgi:hypothetical protein
MLLDLLFSHKEMAIACLHAWSPALFPHLYSSKSAGNTIIIFGGLDINGAQVNYMFELSLEIISLPSIFTPLCSTS